MASSIPARLDRLPITRAHRAAVIIIGIGTFFDLFDIFLAGVLGAVLTSEFALSRFAVSVVIASGFLGMFVGAASLGSSADRLGRKPVFLLNLALYSLFTLAGAFSANAAMLIWSRFLAGLGLGAEPAVVDTYLSELLPARERGRCTVYAYTLGFLGVPAAGLLGRLLVPRRPFGLAGWRCLFMIGSLGAAVVWCLRARLPESPRWLDARGRAAEAEAIVESLEADARRSGARSQGDGLAAPPGPPPHDPATSTSFEAEYRRRALMLWVFQVFQTVGYYGFGTLVPLVLAAKGYSIVNSLTYTAIVFAGYPLGSAVSLVLVERIDRKWLIVSSAFLMSAFGLVLGRSSSTLIIVAIGFSYTIVSNIFSNALHVFQAEIFPTATRATAVGFAYGLSRLSAACMPFVLVPVLERWGPGWMFAVVAGSLWIIIVDIALFAPGTTGRRLRSSTNVGLRPTPRLGRSRGPLRPAPLPRRRAVRA